MFTTQTAVFTAAVAIFGVFVVKAIDVRAETLRRAWEDQQKSRLKGQEAAADMLRAVVLTVAALPTPAGSGAAVDPGVHVAILHMRGYGVGDRLVGIAESIHRVLIRWSATGVSESDQLRELLTSFTTAMSAEFDPRSRP